MEEPENLLDELPDRHSRFCITAVLEVPAEALEEDHSAHELDETLRAMVLALNQTISRNPAWQSFARRHPVDRLMMHASLPSESAVDLIDIRECSATLFFDVADEVLRREGVRELLTEAMRNFVNATVATLDQLEPLDRFCTRYGAPFPRLKVRAPGLRGLR